jgi:hypothetical protein
MSDVFHYQNPNGVLEVYDSKTGQLLEVHPPEKKGYCLSARDSLIPYELPDGTKILAPVSVPAETLDAYLGISNGFNPLVGDLLAQKITEGSPLTKACKELGLSYSLVCRWKRQNPGFSKLLAEAKQDRAEALRDEALALIDNVEEDSDAISKARAQADIRKWAAGADSPQEYSGKAKVESAGVGNVTIIISTGISREERPVEPLDPALPGEVE